MQHERHFLFLVVLVLSVCLLWLAFLTPESAPDRLANNREVTWSGKQEEANSGVDQTPDEIIKKQVTAGTTTTELPNYRQLNQKTTNTLSERTRLTRRVDALLRDNLGEHPSITTGTTGAGTELTNRRSPNQSGGNADNNNNDDPDKLSSPYIHTWDASEQCLNYIDTEKQKEGLRPKIIFYFQIRNFFPEPRGGFEDLCARPTAGPCVLTFDENAQGRAHAIIFHASRLRTTKPPFQKRPGQVWIARGLEAPSNWFPEFRSPGWKGMFNWTMTYRPDSDIFSPVGAMVRIPQAPREDFVKIARMKTRSVAWFVSDCHTLSRREYYVKRMKKYIDVDIFGECGPLKCERHEKECNEMLSRTYRFYLAFENTVCPHYVTEKFFNKFRSDRQPMHIIPVVRGGADYRKYFPDGTYIDAADFASPEDLAKYLNKLSADLGAYAAMLERKSHFGCSRCLKLDTWCRLCDRLHDSALTPRVYDDLGRWWDEEACVNKTDDLDVIRV